MKNNPSTTTFYLFGAEGSYVAAVHVRLFENVNTSVLTHAANSAIRRFPYLALQLKEGADGLFEYISNDRPICVFNNFEDHVLLTEQSNYHALNLEAVGNEIVFNFGHFIMDGKTMMEWIKTVLYYYFCEYTGIRLDPANIRTLSDIIDPEEFDDPLKPYADQALRELLKKNGGKSPFAPNHERVSRKLEDIRDIYGLSDYVDINGKGRTCFFWFRSTDFMKFARISDGSPATLTAAVLTHILHERKPDLNKPVSMDILQDLRPGLGTPLAHHSLISKVFINYPPHVTGRSVETLSTMARGVVILATQSEGYQKAIDGCAKLAAAALAMPDHETRYNELSKNLPTQCCNISYVGIIPFGAVEKYVDEMYVVIPPNPDYLNAEITCLNDKLMFTFTQYFDDTSIVESFADYFASKGITVHNYRVEPLRTTKIRMSAAGQ